jgi:hypothetical protein
MFSEAMSLEIMSCRFAFMFQNPQYKNKYEFGCLSHVCCALSAAFGKRVVIEMPERLSLA